jgi:hypothetical protein
MKVKRFQSLIALGAKAFHLGLNACCCPVAQDQFRVQRVVPSCVSVWHLHEPFSDAQKARI